MNPTDKQLDHVLAKLLPNVLYIAPNGLLAKLPRPEFAADGIQNNVGELERLGLCWLVEEILSETGQEAYGFNLLTLCNPLSELRRGWNATHATHQQKTVALAKTLGVEIVQ